MYISRYLPSFRFLSFILFAHLTLQTAQTANDNLATCLLFALGTALSYALTFTLLTLFFHLIDCYFASSSDRQQRNDG